MEFIVLANGDKYNVSHCGSMNDMMFINFVGYSFVEIASVCSNKEKMSHIEYYYSETSFAKAFDGFTHLSSMNSMEQNEIEVMMKIPEE